MNKDNAKDYLPLVQALADGKVIQWRPNMATKWRDSEGDNHFCLCPSQYRIKPELREIWVNEYPERSPIVYGTKQEAATQLNPFIGGVTNRYREVIE